MTSMRASCLSVAIVLLAGCVGGKAPGAQEAPAIFEPQFGAIEGSVTDTELQPLSGVLVRIAPDPLDTPIAAEPPRETLTDGSGGFRFFEVPVGTWQVSFGAGAEHYQSGGATISVRSDETTVTELRLDLLPSYAPHNLTIPIDGFFECAHEIPIWTGDCMILYETATGQNDTVTSEASEFPFQIADRWETIVLELVWEEGGPNQLDGMRLYVEDPQLSLEGHSVKYARVDGPSQPLRIEIQNGIVPESAEMYPGTEDRLVIPPEGATVLLRVFPRGNLYEYTSMVCDADGQCFLGVGAGLDIQFTIYATVFYNEPAPVGFTGIPG